MTNPSTEKTEGGLPPAEAVELPSLLSIVPESVVSRTLIKRSGGNVTLFSFDRGQGLSEHTAPFDALVLVLEGQVELTIGGKKVLAAAGQTVLMPARISHALHAVEPFKMLLVMIREPLATL
jgi:quercetin dioxygenase-like cupin family protein